LGLARWHDLPARPAGATLCATKRTTCGVDDAASSRTISCRASEPPQ
jgi:hypothetical protein